MPKKFKYTVDIYERWARTFAFESDTPITKEELLDRANQLIEAGKDDQGFEYSDTTEPDEWSVAEFDAKTGHVKNYL